LATAPVQFILLCMTLNGRNSGGRAPFDAALPYTTSRKSSLLHRSPDGDGNGKPQDQPLDQPRAFDIDEAKTRLCAGDGGYELVHESSRVEICVYTLIAPEPDHQRVNDDDELYIVLEGRGALDVGGEQLELREGHAAFIPAGADHLFSAYEHLTVLAILGRHGA
jgi:mannose-6-phosphate isomerase-like protein (cupin superfamily)